MIDTKKKERYVGIKIAIQHGYDLQKLYPEIVENYRNKMSLKEIACKYKVADIFGVKEDSAPSIVRYALVGYQGDLFSNFKYNGLMSKEEMHDLGKVHKKLNGERKGKEHKNQKTGIFGMDNYSKSEACRKGGKKGGKALYKSGKGLFSMSKDEKSRASRKAIQNALKTMGKIAWKDRIETNLYCTLYTEKDTAYKLSKLPEYRNVKGTNRKLISKYLNELFHNGETIRTPEAIGTMLYSFKKKEAK